MVVASFSESCERSRHSTCRAHAVIAGTGQLAERARRPKTFPVGRDRTNE